MGGTCRSSTSAVSGSSIKKSIPIQPEAQGRVTPPRVTNARAYSSPDSSNSAPGSSKAQPSLESAGGTPP